MKFTAVVSLIACLSGIYGQGLDIGALLGGTTAPSNTTAPAVPGAPVAPAPAPVAPAAPSAPVPAGNQPLPSAQSAPAAPVAPVAPAAPAPAAAPKSKAPCPYANKGASPAAAPAAGAPAAAPGTPAAGTPPPAAPAQPVVGPKAREMDNQLTNLRTAIELFQDFQRQYQLADDNPIMQQIYQLFGPILQAANNIR